MSVDRISKNLIPPSNVQIEDEENIQNVQTTDSVVTESPPVHTGGETDIFSQLPPLDSPTTKPDPKMIENVLNKFDQISDEDLNKLAEFLAKYISNLPPDLQNSVQGQGNNLPGAGQNTKGDSDLGYWIIAFSHTPTTSNTQGGPNVGNNNNNMPSVGSGQTGDTGGEGEEGGDDFTVGDGLSFGEFIQLMQLMQKIFQQQRKTARELRHAEMELQQSEIEKQVEALKDAATTALVMGIVMAAITIGMATMSSAKSIKAAKRFSKSIDVEFSVKGIKAYREPGAQPKLENKTAPEKRPGVKDTESTQPKTEETQPTTQPKTQAKSSDQIKQEQKKLEQKNTDQKETEKTEQEQEEQVKTETEKQRLKEAKTRDQKQVEEAKKADQKEAEKTEDVQEEEQPELDSEQQKLAELRDKAQKQFEKMKKNLGDELPEGIRNKQSIDELDEHDLAQLEALAGQLGKVEGEIISNTANLWRTYNQSLGQFMGGMRDFFTQNQMAEATKHEGVAKLHEQRLQDATEWMQNMRDLIKDVQETVRAVQQSLIETQRTIFTQV